MRRSLLVASCLFFIGFESCRAESPDAQLEPTRQDCEAGVAQARVMAFSLPADDLSRYFAERHLQQALAEGGNGEFDDCLEWVEHAIEEVREHRHSLRPGEKLDIKKADE